MKLKVLGCVSPICTKSDNLSGYLISFNNEKILLDAGSGITRNMTFPDDLNNLTIIITHLHPDHYTDVYNIINLVKQYKRNGITFPPITLYIPNDPFILYKYISNEAEDALVVKKYTSNTKIKGSNYEITFCPVTHGEMKTHAVKITNSYNSFIYTGDTSNIGVEKLIEFSKKAKVILCDSSLLKSEGFSNDKYHMTAFEASNYARLAECEKLILTHFNSLKKEDDKIVLEAANNFSNLVLAESGVEYNLW